MDDAGGWYRAGNTATEAMQLQLHEISRHVAMGAIALLLMERAGWHTTSKLELPANIKPIFLPSRSPELTRWRTSGNMLANWLSNRVFERYDGIVETAREAWKKLSKAPDTIEPSACAIGLMWV